LTVQHETLVKGYLKGKTAVLGEEPVRGSLCPP